MLARCFHFKRIDRAFLAPREIRIMKYTLIERFFSDPTDAGKFFVQLKELRIATPDTKCMAVLSKTDHEKWTYELIWEDGRYVGEQVKPFRPSKENISKFNLGCKEIAKRLRIYLETDDLKQVPLKPPAFGDLSFETLS